MTVSAMLSVSPEEQGIRHGSLCHLDTFARQKVSGHLSNICRERGVVTLPSIGGKEDIRASTD